MDHDDLIQQFIGIVPCEVDKARFYLEANNWDINAAMSNFYEEPPMSSALPSSTLQPPAPLPAEDELLESQLAQAAPTGERRRSAVPGLVPNNSTGITAANAPLGMGRTLGGGYEPIPTPVGGSTAIAPSQPPSSTSRIGTLSSLQSAGADSSPMPGLGQDAPGPNKKDPQNWYTGGEKSGMMVEAPHDPNNPSSIGNAFNMVHDILRKAAEGSQGPEAEGEGEGSFTSGFSGAQPLNKPSNESYGFKGQGHRLGTMESSEQASTSTVQSSSPTGQPTRQDNTEVGDEPSVSNHTPVTRQLTFYRNGFVIADGPLMHYDDPTSRTFLEAINNGTAPLSMLNVRPGQPVEVQVARRMDEDYTPPPPERKPFGGQGQRLGSVATSSVQTQTTTTSAARGNTPTVDPNQPTTSVQIRLADGSRVVAKLNHSHTIADLRQFILAQRPADATRPFILQTNFPTKILADESQTLQESNLLNAVVVQKYE
ncbi:protein phosphatase regulator [Dispira parvispora]|uniref:Protein phosphatase regulator n=1 Tax=Dispira parvispora TaxID=1520584 RepID=A0A9W8AW12_9FUNG|nr:protein phosphatase regulator [Dispira parvispora]